MARRFREHWPEYLIEAWALGMFMVSAGLFTLLIEHPDFGIREHIDSAAVRRCLIGIAMGLTAVGLIYSPWGRRSGAHMNPAVTLSFLWLRRITRFDALAYVVAQFLGGLAGVLLMAGIFGDAFTQAPVSFVATLPGAAGRPAAFASECVISWGLMTAVLAFTSRERIAPYTGLAAGTLVAVFIALESPFSGMSMNPARSFASALPGGFLADLWIYFAAPLIGMSAAAAAHAHRKARGCAKLMHDTGQRCIHCGFTPPAHVSVDFGGNERRA